MTSPGKPISFLSLSQYLVQGLAQRKWSRKYFLSLGYTPMLSQILFFNAFVYTCVHCVQRSGLEAFCMLSYLIVSSTLRGKPPYTTDKETKLQRSQVTSSALPSWWAVELIGAQIYQSLDHFTAFWCLCFHISGKPLWESRLHQLCLGQPSKMGWVHALARVLENLTDGGWLGSRGDGREGRWKWQPWHPLPK